MCSKRTFYNLSVTMDSDSTPGSYVMTNKCFNNDQNLIINAVYGFFA